MYRSFAGSYPLFVSKMVSMKVAAISPTIDRSGIVCESPYTAAPSSVATTPFAARSLAHTVKFALLAQSLKTGK